MALEDKYNAAGSTHEKDVCCVLSSYLTFEHGLQGI